MESFDDSGSLLQPRRILRSYRHFQRCIRLPASVRPFDTHLETANASGKEIWNNGNIRSWAWVCDLVSQQQISIGRTSDKAALFSLSMLCVY